MRGTKIEEAELAQRYAVRLVTKPTGVVYHWFSDLAEAEAFATGTHGEEVAYWELNEYQPVTYRYQRGKPYGFNEFVCTHRHGKPKRADGWKVRISLRGSGGQVEDSPCMPEQNARRNFNALREYPNKERMRAVTLIDPNGVPVAISRWHGVNSDRKDVVRG